MRTKLYLNGTKITKKAAIELVGEQTFKGMLAEAKNTFMNDPLVENDFFIGHGFLTIRFE